MTSVDPAAADLERSSERWLTWLAVATIRRQDPPESALYALWDALEGWFASDDFAGSALAAAVVAPPDGRGPAALAGQLLTLVEGAMAGALIDRHPGVARHARELTRIAMAGG
jgi:hypothetical protein